MRGTHVQKSDPTTGKTRRRGSLKKLVLAAVTAVAMSILTLSSTVAYILTNSESISNVFEPSKVSCQISESFDGITKSNVKVLNTGEAPVYIRVKLLPQWYGSDSENIVAKTAWTPVFTPGSGWVQGADGFWYYTSPVAPGSGTVDLISSITLLQDDVTLYQQALEIIASCIQAEPDDAVLEAWAGVTAVNDGKLTVAQNNQGE